MEHSKENVPFSPCNIVFPPSWRLLSWCLKVVLKRPLSWFLPLGFVYQNHMWPMLSPTWLGHLWLKVCPAPLMPSSISIFRGPFISFFSLQKKKNPDLWYLERRKTLMSIELYLLKGSSLINVYTLVLINMFTYLY